MNIKTKTCMTPEGPIVFRYEVPSEMLYDRYENENRRDTSNARTNLVKACVHSHTGAELDAIFEKYPAVKHALALSMCLDCGAGFEFLEGEVLPS